MNHSTHTVAGHVIRLQLSAGVGLGEGLGQHLVHMRGAPFVGHHIADTLAPEILVEGEQLLGLSGESTLVVELEIRIVRGFFPLSVVVAAGPLGFRDPAVPWTAVDMNLSAVRQEPLLLVALVGDESLVSERRAFELLVGQPAQALEP
ncbi:hypothetical protein [Streptomyces prasinus]